jgi:hypothetical protein
MAGVQAAALPGVTPGFYCYDSDASLGALPAGEALGTPVERRRLAPAQADAVHRSLGRLGATSGQDPARAEPADPISDLSHLPAFRAEAEAAVHAVAERALEAPGGVDASDAGSGRQPEIHMRARAPFSQFAFRA